MAFATHSVKNLFPTPFIMAALDPDVSSAINRQLIDLLFKKSEADSGVTVSNAGGWQSDHALPEWGGAPVITILDALKALIGKITLPIQNGQAAPGLIEWKINGWANINRKGDSNLVHTHPGAYWSAVYYVLTDDNDHTGGELELLDPRGALPLMYCPLLRVGLQGHLTAGNTELHKPKAGECIIFPSWLQHSVRRYTGDATRISLAFNFSI